MRNRSDDGFPPALLLRSIREPEILTSIPQAQWEPLLSCARRNSTLAYLCALARDAAVLDAVPESPRIHLISAEASAARLAQLARWELDRVRRVLGHAAIPVIAFKGAAYLLRGLPHAMTRRLSDIDVMVPKMSIEAAEQALLAAGWSHTILDPYDRHYYRRWAHELPPLLYPGRLLAVDVHFTICPPVSRLRPDPAAFWARAEPSSHRDVLVLSPEDAFLHAVVHLFFDSDFDSRFRDLVDLHELIRQFGPATSFWPGVVIRARDLGLGRPLYYALATLDRVLGTAITGAVRQEVDEFAPSRMVSGPMVEAMTKLLTPIDPEPWPPPHGFLRWSFYVRSHWLRMPAHGLIPHLARKSLRRWRADGP